MDDVLKISVYKGIKKSMLKAFEDEQWPIADKEHYGDAIPHFRKQKYTIVAIEGSLIVGHAYLFIDTGVATIDSLLVHHTLRRKGIASALLQEAESKAKVENCHVVSLETGRDWKAKEFYEKHGYTTRAILEGYYGNKDFLLMDKRI